MPFSHHALHAMPTEPNRLAIVTGAASGLGRAFCRQLIAISGNWHIVLVDIDDAGARQTLSAIGASSGATAEYVSLDVTDAAGWLELRHRLRCDWPRLDLLVNNAGVCMSGEMGEGSLEAWRRVIEVNCLGVLNGCHTMTPWLKESANRGAPRPAAGSAPPPAVINVASIMAFVPPPALGAYSASKAAVAALSESMYAELRPHRVHVTLLVPGFFRTKLLDNAIFAASSHRDYAEDFVRTAKFDADFVARQALSAAARGQFYAVVGRRARWYWRWKRSAPMSLLRGLSWRYRRAMQTRTVD